MCKIFTSLCRIWSTNHCRTNNRNPYRAINPAIRSRTHIYRLNEITKDDIILLLKKTIEKENMLPITEDILNYIAIVSSCEIRSSLNMLEIINMLEQDERDLEHVKALVGKKACDRWRRRKLL